MNIIRAEKRHIGQMYETEKLSFSDPWPESGFESSISSPAEIAIAAEENGEICGYIIGSCDGYQGYIEKIAVNPRMRRKGIGGRLLSAFISAMPDTAEEAVLDVRESNIVAMALYEKSGFKRIGVRRSFYSNPKENGVVMVYRTEGKSNER